MQERVQKCHQHLQMLRSQAQTQVLISKSLATFPDIPKIRAPPGVTRQPLMIRPLEEPPQDLSDWKLEIDLDKYIKKPQVIVQETVIPPFVEPEQDPILVDTFVVQPSLIDDPHFDLYAEEQVGIEAYSLESLMSKASDLLPAASKPPVSEADTPKVLNLPNIVQFGQSPGQSLPRAQPVVIQQPVTEDRPKDVPLPPPPPTSVVQEVPQTPQVRADSRLSLLDSIRQSGGLKALKPAKEKPQQKKEPKRKKQPDGQLMGALADALAARRKKMSNKELQELGIVKEASSDNDDDEEDWE